jgi:hypothetical protein
VTTVAGGQLVEHPVKLAPLGARARHLLAVDVPAAASGGAELVKLAVEGLPVGAEAGIADKPCFGVSFGHILCKPLPIDLAGKCTKVSNFATAGSAFLIRSAISAGPCGSMLR